MPWLVAGDQVVASLEIANTHASRRKGLLGRDGIEGALLLDPARSVHTIGMKFPIDVAHLDGDMVVIAVTTMKPGRIGGLHTHTKKILEAEAGSMHRWGVEPGVQLEIKG